MKILVINGPNINMLGIREPEIYGNKTYGDLVDLIKNTCKKYNITVKCFQSNCEGEIVTEIQNAYKKYDGIIINPAAYTHTSIAIPDAIKSVGIPCVEVHISDTDKREDFRRISYIGSVAEKTIKGKGFDGYTEAVEYFINNVY